MQSREREDARLPSTPSTAAEPTEDATEDCVEFEVGPVIGDLHRAQETARSTTDPCSGDRHAPSEPNLACALPR